ncbi:unnamed protein product [Bursaphelenchus okinawaensis]|uniref:Uncharacterized protein n=1 Tax=Bursaphelenchus okinawaensis TaxID=465554 RepID=A0A811KNE0_9BILA|nr:unnamed protein product [Bursaphelenchus okinawaensis]CAG9107466.1 unnamed protein product [Bursaphelenchus okinawaensis]
MAFIVPLMKKDYALYGPKRSNSFAGVPRRVTTPKRDKMARVPKLSLDETTNPSMLCTSTSTTPDSSASTSPTTTAPIRRQSKRISIRQLDDNIDRSTCSSASPVDNFNQIQSPERHVHFGFCEEICYGSEDEDEVFDESGTKDHKTLRKSNSVPNDGTAPLVGVLRNRTNSTNEIAVQKSKMAAVFKWVRLCAPRS